MSTSAFDTLKFVKQLEASGIAPVQAEAFVNAQRDILAEALDTSLATRADLLSVKNDVDRLDAKLDAKFDKLQWMLGIVIALAIANFAKQFF
jgi:hypothetical protein